MRINDELRFCGCLELKNTQTLKISTIETLLGQKDEKQLRIESDEIVSGKFRFNNAWDMERSDKPYRLKKGKFYFSPNDDPEWVYQCVRMEFLRKLLIAAEIFGDSKYIEEYNKIVKNFFKENNFIHSSPASSGESSYRKFYRKAYKLINMLFSGGNTVVSTYRTLDTAIRNGILSIDMYYSDTLHGNYRKGVIRRIKHDMDFTLHNLKIFDETSNWGIIILSNYLTCSCILGNENNNIIKVQHHLEKMLNEQIRSDGGHIENSNMYHTQIVLSLLRVIYWCDKSNIPITTSIREYCSKMVDFTVSIAAPDGFQIMYGDSDHTCLDTIIYLASKILNNTAWKCVNKPRDYILLWEFPEYWDRSENLYSAHKNQNVVLDEGIWAFDNNILSIRVFNEESKSGHKHADNGEVVFYFKGHPILIDTGRFSYFEGTRRKYYRSPLAHNVSIVDDGSVWEQINNWEYKNFPHVTKNKLISTNPVQFECSFVFLEDMQRLTRKFIVINEDCLLVVSEACSKGSHTLSTIWNFDSGVKCEQIGKNTILINVRNEKVYMNYTGEAVFSNGQISYHYNEETVDCKKLIVTNKFLNQTLQLACFSSVPVSLIIDNNKCFKVIRFDGEILFEFSEISGFKD